MNPDLASKLSPAALAALQQHLAIKEVSSCASFANDNTAKDFAKSYANQVSNGTLADKMKATENMNTKDFEHVRNENAGVDEDFGMSQFWYTTATADTLAKEALSIGGTADKLNGYKRVAFVSCPSAFKAAMPIVDDETDITVFEYDRRFGDVYGDQFCFFDFNFPDRLPEEYHHAFDYVMADPPYLDENCMKQTLKAMRLLARDDDTPMCFNTGAVMADAIYKHAQFRESKFHPEHASKLGNEFSTFVNYAAEGLGGVYPLEE